MITHTLKKTNTEITTVTLDYTHSIWNQSAAVVIDIRHRWRHGLSSTGNRGCSISRHSPCWRSNSVGECPGLGCAITTSIRVGVDDSTTASRIVSDGWRQCNRNQSAAVVIDKIGRAHV